MATQKEIEVIGGLLKPLRSPTIVELGACDGTDTDWLIKACGETPRYVMVEPDPRNVQFLLDRKFLRAEHITLLAAAVGAEVGLVTFHMCDWQIAQGLGSGSIRQPTGHLKHFPKCEFPYQTTVPCYTLDALFRREWLSKIDLLWVDIQGAERDMIAGGRQALEKTRYLFMEAEDKEMYEGQATKPELLAMLPEWELIGEYDWNVLLRNREFVERTELVADGAY